MDKTSKSKKEPRVGIWHAEKYFEFENWAEANKHGFWLEDQKAVTYSKVMMPSKTLDASSNCAISTSGGKPSK